MGGTLVDSFKNECHQISEENIKNKIKLARVEKDLTQQELAEKIGVTRQTIGLIERGEYNPTIVLCLKLSCVLEKSLNELFWLEVKQDEN